MSVQTRWVIVVRVAALVALLTSAFLYVDYTHAVPNFCGVGGGCDMIRRSGFGHIPLGFTSIPVPLAGLIGFSALFAATLIPQTRSRKLATLVLGALGGVLAIALIVLQGVVLGTFCTLCVVTDIAALIAAGAAYAQYRSRDELVGDPLRAWAWALFPVVLITAPLLWPSLKPAARVPDAIRRYYVPGKINVIEFADFECPFCRRLHGDLKRIIADYGDRVHFVRLNMPLDSHPHARDAARAAICAEHQNKGEAMADHLFETEDLSLRANLEAARQLGLDVSAFERCLRDRATDQRIKTESRLLQDQFLGLPTTYVGAEQIVGAQPEEKFREAFDKASRAERRGITGAAYVTVVGVALLLVGLIGRRRRAG